MSRTGVTHTDTASGKGGGQLTENPMPSDKAGHRPQAQQPAPRSGEGQGGTNQADQKNKQQR